MILSYMLDTNMVSYIVKGRSPAASARLLALHNDQISTISAITVAEIRYGLARRPEGYGSQIPHGRLSRQHPDAPMGPR